MAHSFLIFDFGTSEEAAQQARHRLEGWKQAFRLDKKLQLKFERKETEPVGVEAAKSAAGVTKAGKSTKAAAKGKAKPGGKAKAGSQDPPSANGAEATEAPADVRMIVRLDFSDHEKLSYQRWIERIPADELFKGASPKIVRAGEPEFGATSELFDSLD